MLILAIEAATPQVGCAIGGHEGVIAEFHITRGRRHAETLAPAIEFVCERAGIALGDLGAVAVDVGPGLYTGMRVGIATAKALAFALRIPVLTASSLDLLAHAYRHAVGTVWPVIDARRSEVFTAAYRPVPGGLTRVTDPVVMTPSDLATEVLAQAGDHLLVGDGAVRYREALLGDSTVDVAVDGPMYPGAGTLATLAHAYAMREEFVRLDEVQPVYLRAPDAEVNFERRAV